MRTRPDTRLGTSRDKATPSSPGFIAPALAQLARKPPTGPHWIHEIKFDGYRLQAHVDGGEVRLLTRNGHDWTTIFGREVAEAFSGIKASKAILDGELVVENKSGTSDFSALQADLADRRTDRFVAYLFDLMSLDGKDLTALPLKERKRLLASILPDSPRLKFSVDFTDPGELVLAHACRLGLEGIVSKRIDGPYRSGRGRLWIKTKCVSRQEFVIGGFEVSSTSRTLIGSLLLGLYDGDQLTYVGSVGTGFTQRVSADLFRRLSALQLPTSPFANVPAAALSKSARFAYPAMVAEIEYRAWTSDGQLRHASFKGLREDKDPSTVVRELPEAD